MYTDLVTLVNARRQAISFEINQEVDGSGALSKTGTMNYAGFWIRAVAHLIDFVLVNAIEYGLEESLARILGISAFSQQVVGIIFSLILGYLYYVEIPQRRGTTLGKQVFGIYVVDEKTGLNFSRKQATIRLFSYLLSYAIVGCGFLMAAFHPEKRALHDLIAGTVSIRRKKENAILVSDPTVPEKISEAH